MPDHVCTFVESATRRLTRGHRLDCTTWRMLAGLWIDFGDLDPTPKRAEKTFGLKFLARTSDRGKTLRAFAVEI